VYIRKPLRYESVADRLRQVIAHIRRKKEETVRQSGLPVVLIADPDPNFCDFAVSTLAGHFTGLAARSAADALVGVLKTRARPDSAQPGTARPALRGPGTKGHVAG
jgi:hypothetical protein